MTPYLFAIEPALMVLSAAAFAVDRKVTVSRCAGLAGSFVLVGGVGVMAVHGVLRSWGLL